MNYLFWLAQNTDENVKKIFGDGISGAPFGDSPVPEAFATIFGFLIRLLFIVAAVFVLVYLLWGAFEYITSGGEQDKVANARKKMTAAAVGIIMLVLVLSVWLLLVTNVFGLFGSSGGGFTIELPTLRQDTDSTPTDPDLPRGPEGDRRPIPQ